MECQCQEVCGVIQNQIIPSETRLGNVEAWYKFVKEEEDKWNVMATRFRSSMLPEALETVSDPHSSTSSLQSLPQLIDSEDFWFPSTEVLSTTTVSDGSGDTRTRFKEQFLPATSKAQDHAEFVLTLRATLLD